MEKKKAKKLYPYVIRYIVNASDEHIPDIQDGQILEFELRKKGQPLENGAYYYIKHNGEKMIRKIYVTDTGLMLVRANPKYSSDFYEFTNDREKQLVILEKLNLHPNFSKKDEK